MTRRLIFIMLALLVGCACIKGLTRPADAALVGSPHDFSALGGSPCGYCHSVHNSAGGSGLMNSNFGNFPMVTNVYSSPTMNHKIDLNVVNRSDAPLCLACHDSASVAAKAPTNPDFAEIKNRLDARTPQNAYINVDLSNDHPVGFVYNPALDPNLKTPTTAQTGFGPTINQMWCSTCHNVHNNANGKFLVMTNANSALCLDCHIK